MLWRGRAVEIVSIIAVDFVTDIDDAGGDGRDHRDTARRPCRVHLQKDDGACLATATVHSVTTPSAV